MNRAVARSGRGAAQAGFALPRPANGRIVIGRPRVALVIAPHPDDEAIGAWGLIRALRARGTAVRVVVVSDGAASHAPTPAWPTARLVAARRAESRRCMAGLGVMAGDVAFLGLPDGALPECRAVLARRLGRAVRRARRLDLIVLPDVDDAHPDHRAVAAAVSRHRARRLAYLVWPARARRRGGTIVTQRPGKRRAVCGYATQTGRHAGLAHGFAIAPHELAAFAHPVERYR